MTAVNSTERKNNHKKGKPIQTFRMSSCAIWFIYVDIITITGIIWFGIKIILFDLTDDGYCSNKYGVRWDSVAYPEYCDDDPVCYVSNDACSPHSQISIVLIIYWAYFAFHVLHINIMI